MSKLDQYLESNRLFFEEQLCDLLKIASVSADGHHQQEIGEAADWLVKEFNDIGLTTELIETAGNPIVYAESPPVEGAPTVLIYGHYDVQPPEPLEEWLTPPFEPTRRDGNIVARGATDDKGQFFTHIKSAAAILATAGKLPVQLKYVIEGEEEVGSESLYAVLEQRKEQLACDIAVVSDTSQFGPGQPAITYGLKGIAYFELTLTGPRQDLHSGTFGGAVTNPANTLARMLAAIVDENGRVQIPGFYDSVEPLGDSERGQMAALPFKEDAFMDQIGVKGVSGESGYSTLERRWARPTYDINGLTSGYQGDGAKTVLPCRASAKFSFRLVKDQDPDKIAEDLRAMLTELCPPGITLDLQDMHGARAVVVPLDSTYINAAAKAIELGFGSWPLFIREGGSIPIVTAFSDTLGVDTLLLGWGLDDDNTHGPNEKFSLADFHRGIKASANLWLQLGKLPSE